METKLQSVILFDVDEDAPQRLLTQATDAGLEAARFAIVGSVDANGRLGSAKDGLKRVRIELAIRVGAGGPAQGLAAEKAFAEAFIGTLAKKGHAVERA